MTGTGSTPSTTAPLTRQARILVASPRREGRELVHWLDDRDYELCYLKELEEFDEVVTTWKPDVVALDEALPNLGEGEWIRRARRQTGAICILLVERYDAQTLVRTVEAGAEAFLSRQCSGPEFLRVVEQELRALDGPPRPESRLEPPMMVGDSPQMREICRTVAVTAPSDATVLITGESGTGKELVARAIHRFSPRRDRPFVAINCGAIPPGLVEGELFGHVEGAFTGATSDRRGVFERADGGTLFLDEIGELSPSVQVKLLRVLEYQHFEPVGSADSLDVDVRVVAATNSDIRQAVESEEFRADLYYRLNVLHIELPPLRRRDEDIQRLWDHFIRLFADDEGRGGIDTSPEVLQRLKSHDWPGNVRELGNVARHSVTMRERLITPGGLPSYLSDDSDDQPRSETSPPGGRREDDDVRIPGMSLEQLERVAILRTVESTDTIKDAAEILGISERTLYYRLEKYRED